LNVTSLVTAADLDRALDVAAKTKRWLIATVSVSSVSDRIDTMLDADVIGWLDRHALIAQITSESEGDLAKLLCVRAVPTLIAFREGLERTRMVITTGRRDILGWLTALDTLPATFDIGLRHSAADILRVDQRFDEATEAYLWLWNSIPGIDPDYVRVRVSLIAQQIASFANVHPGARAAFAEIRDASGIAAGIHDAKGWFGPRVDWIALNDVVGDRHRTLEWYSAIRNDPKTEPARDHVASLLLEPLKEARRWSDIGRLFSDPAAKLRDTYRVLGLGRFLGPRILGNERFATVTRVTADMFREDAVTLYAGLIAAGRSLDASVLRSEAMRLDPSDEMRSALDNAPTSYN
jgi:hypothetical protein